MATNVDDIQYTETTKSEACNIAEQRLAPIEWHPDFRCKWDDYIAIDDCLRGERQIKRKRTLYLPKTTGMESKDQDAKKSYDKYLERAVYYNFPQDTNHAAAGMLTREPANFELPDNLTTLIENATPDNETLQELQASIYEAQTSYGRIGLLIDVPFGVENPETPHITTYSAFNVINWVEDYHEGKRRLRAVILNESGFEAGPGMSQDYKYHYRICALDENNEYWTMVVDNGGIAGLDMDTFNPPAPETDDDTEDTDEAPDPYPNWKGHRLDYIPFVPINVSDLRIRPQTSPLLDVVDLSLAVYRGEADYRQALFKQGQGTPYGTGLKAEERNKIGLLGAETMIFADNPDAEFGFMEVSGNGLSEMREGLNELKNAAIQKGVALVDMSNESGRALTVRVGTKTSQLKVIARTGAAGLRMALAMIVDWMTKGDGWKTVPMDEVNVTANTDFVDDDNTQVAEELVKLMSAKSMGARISNQSIHEWMEKKELTTRTFEEEGELVDGDGPMPGAVTTTGQTGADDFEDGDDNPDDDE